MNQQICFSDLPLLTKDVVSNVENLIKMGADIVEIMMDGKQWNDMEELFEDLAPKLQQLPIEYTVHPPAWDINLTSENKMIRDASFIEYCKAIEFASMIGAHHVVIHPGFTFCEMFDKKVAQNRAKQSIKALCDIAEPLNVTLAIENVGYRGSSIFTQQEYVHFLDDISKTAGYLIDVGHAQLNNWDIAATIDTVKERLVALHLHDNDGQDDVHLPIGEGEIDWESIFNLLRDQKIDCQLILEYAPNTDMNRLAEGKELVINALNELRKVE